MNTKCKKNQIFSSIPNLSDHANGALTFDRKIVQFRHICRIVGIITLLISPGLLKGTVSECLIFVLLIFVLPVLNFL